MVFLDTLARALLQRHGNLEEIAVVLPSHRAGIHLRKYLAQAAGKPLWSPVLYEPGSFLTDVAGWRLLDPVEALLELHRCHVGLLGDRAEPLDEFLQWAPTTLHDFSEVDAHLIGLPAFYKDLRLYHEIEEWSFHGTDRLSRAQLLAVERWRQMGELHERFAQRCAEGKAGTAGAIARQAASTAGDDGWTPPWREVWFAGLNALDPALRTVAAALAERGLARFAWDADHHYLDDTAHEAGRFLRRSIKALGPGELPPINAIDELPRTIASIALPDRAAMVRHAVQWALDLMPEEREDAAIVLADESLVLPLLEALPAAAGPLNVTMGAALAALPVKSLEDAFRRLLDAIGPQGAMPAPELRALLAHPMLHEGEPTRALIQSIGDRPVALMELVAFARSAGLKCEAPMEAAVDPAADRSWTDRLRALHAWALHAHGDDALVRAQLHALAKADAQLERHLAEHGSAALSSGGARILRERLTRGMRLSLHGEPLQGLQVMGLLETRALQPRHVLVLGAEEGVLIGGDAPQSWIPYAIRRRWELPLASDADAITSYHVHRLLHGAARMVLAHGAGPQEKEPARFIAQWRHSFHGHPRTQVVERAMVAPLKSAPSPRIEAAKTPAVLQRLHEMAALGFTPTQLGRWLSCPLDFHAQHILGISDEPALPGTLTDTALGSAIHKVLEGVLTPVIGQRLEPRRLLDAADAAHGLLTQQLRTMEFPTESLRTGRNRLLVEMGANAVARYLRAEAARCGQEVMVVSALEQHMVTDLSEGVRLRGIIDRIDLRDGLLHVLDVKTGRVDEAGLKLRLDEERILRSGQHQALQLICYAVLAFRHHAGADALRAGLLPLRKASPDEPAWLSINGTIDIPRSALPALEDIIRGIAQRILDPDEPFMHDAAAAHCLTCVA